MSTGAPRRGDIQGLRAIAVLMVVIFHAGLPLPGGFVGVDVFFVISGYVITRMLRTELTDTGGVRLGTFYLRRIRRILPALALLLVFTLGASVLLAPIGGQEVTARTGAAAAYFNANNYLIRTEGGYFAVSSSVNALLHTWSLSVEEQFYLFFPAFLLGAWVLARRTRWIDPARALVFALVAIVAVSFAASWMLTYERVGPLPIAESAQRIAFYSSPTRAWEFALGGLVAYLARPFSRMGPMASLTLAFAGIAGIVWSAFAIDGLTPFPGTVALVPVGATALLIAAGERAGGNPVNQAMAFSPVQQIGNVSYSWYLWHWPLIVFAAALWPRADGALVAAAALSIVPAWLSLRFVENPIRLVPRPRTRRTLALAGLCILVPIVAAVGLGRAHQRLVRTDEFLAFESAFAYHYDAANGCDNATPVGERRQPECAWLVANPMGKAVLIGDSNAGQFTEGFTKAAQEAGWDATVATMSSCPFVDLVPIANGTTDQQCRAFVTESISGLIAMHPDVVVIATSSDWYVTDDGWAFESPDGQTLYVRTADKSAAWTAGLERVIRTLQAGGTDVAVVHPVPKFGAWDPRACAAIRWLRDRASCGLSRDTASLLFYRAPAMSAEARAVTDTGVETIDLASTLCPEERCTTFRGGVWRWRDGSHISVEQSELLAGRFRELLERSVANG